MATIPDARDKRIAELEKMCADLKDTIRSQRDTIDALQQTNQILSEQLEETSKQLESSNEQFLLSRGLSGSDLNLNRSLSIDETNVSFRKDSSMSQSSDQYSNAQSVQTAEDDVYSSGDDVETFKTMIDDDHELLPIKQGSLKKKSENVHRYNSRYVILYPSFLLYYDSCPIKIDNKRKRKTSLNVMGKKKNAGNTNNDINHPKGTVFLRNYHVAIRKDEKKKRFDITFVPHESAISMGLAAGDARIRFRCKTASELKDWTDKIRTAITSANSGFIKYDIRTDIISNDLSNLGRVTGNGGNQNENGTKPRKQQKQQPRPDANDEKNEDENDSPKKDKQKTKMFDVNDLKEMMKREEELRNELESARRTLSKLEQEKEQLKTELAIKTTEVESEQNVAFRMRKDLEARMADVESREKTLKEEIATLRLNISKLEQKQREQHKKLRRYKSNEEQIERHIETFKQWNQRLQENSLQHLGCVYPNSSNKQLFEHCQKGCVALLEAVYSSLQQKSAAAMTQSTDDEHKEAETENERDSTKKKKRQHKKSKLCQEMMATFQELFKSHIKTTINYASLQQAHNGVVQDFKTLRQDFEQYENDDSNTLNDDALIMASMTASFF